MVVYPGHRNGKSPMCTLNGRSKYPWSDNGQGPNELFKCAMLTLRSPATDPQAKDNTILIPSKPRSAFEIFSSKLTGGIRTRREASKPKADEPSITMTVDMIKDEWDALTDEERGVFENLWKDKEKAREHGEKKKDISPSNIKEALQPAATARSKILVKVGNMEIVVRAVADTGATVAIVNKTLVD